MVDPSGTELLTLAKAGVGWVLVAARAGGPTASGGAPAKADAPAPAMRLRATITIDIDARDLEEAERKCDRVRDQFEALKGAHPEAVLTFQRRKPRTARRAPAPALVVSPYADD